MKMNSHKQLRASHPRGPFRFLAISMLLISLFSCQSAEEEKETSIVVQNFAETFFNYDFGSAKQWTTPESMKWIKFAASNISQADLDIINTMNVAARCETSDVVLNNDTMAVAHISLLHATWIDKTEKNVRTDNGSVSLYLRKRNGLWRVHLTEIPKIEYNRK